MSIAFAMIRVFACHLFRARRDSSPKSSHKRRLDFVGRRWKCQEVLSFKFHVEQGFTVLAAERAGTVWKRVCMYSSPPTNKTTLLGGFFVRETTFLTIIFSMKRPYNMGESDVFAVYRFQA